VLYLFLLLSMCVLLRASPITDFHVTIFFEA